MKRSIKWHEEVLDNRRNSHIKDLEVLMRLKAKIEKDATEIEFYQNQINKAKELHKDGFDSDRFIKSRSGR